MCEAPPFHHGTRLLVAERQARTSSIMSPFYLVYLFVCGYVVMPEHLHVLVSEPKNALLGTAIQALKLSVTVQ